MLRDKKVLSRSSRLLMLLLESGYWVGRLQGIGTMSRAFYPEVSEYYARKNFNRLIQRLKQKGYINYEYKEAERMIKLTKHGELEALLQKSFTEVKTEQKEPKWTIVAFDVPEDARHIRDKLRNLLKAYGFKALQASVYISPTPLSDDGYEYLRRSHLIDFIRIFSTHSNAYTTDLRDWYAASTKNSRPSKNGRRLKSKVDKKGGT